MHKGKRFQVTRDFSGAVSDRWSVFPMFAFPTDNVVWRRLKMPYARYVQRWNTSFAPKDVQSVCRKSHLTSSTGGDEEKLLSVYTAEQQQQAAVFNTTQEIARRQCLTFRVSMRRTLKLSPACFVWYFLCSALLHLPFLLLTGLMPLEWELQVEVIKRCLECLTNC